MIDTDKYEGHTEGPWELSPDDWVWAEHLFMQDNTTNFGNAMLITDAPLLLAEVKRLREELDTIKSSRNYINMQRYGHSVPAFGAAVASYYLLHEDEEYDDEVFLLHRHGSAESIAELKKLTAEEYFLFGAGDFDAEGFYYDDWTQKYHGEMLRYFIRAQVRFLEAEGGVEELRQRLQRDYGDEEE